MPQPRILMCPPEHYGIEYEINAWMSRARQADQPTAMTQWRALVALLRDAGAAIELIEPAPGLPDLVFTANAALVYRNQAVISHFRPVERQGEEPLFAEWFEQHGFRVARAPGEAYFEGAGDALFCGDTLYAGYRIRSHALGEQQLAETLGVHVIPLELVDPYYYHLDTCFCPLADGQAIYFPPAFDEYGLRVLRERITDLVEVVPDEARRFAANAVVVGRTVITNTGCPRLHTELKSRGFEPRQTPLDEFVKAGGSAKCLTLRLDGEDAAAWRNDE